MAFEYWGDSKLPEWKSRWDYIVLNLRRPLDDDDLRGIYLKCIRASTSALKSHVEYYDRIDAEHEHHAYQWLAMITDKVIEEKRRGDNIESLVQGTKSQAISCYSRWDRYQSGSRQEQGERQR